MAVGTKGGLLKRQPLQSYLKHELLGGYVPVFANSLSKGTPHPVTLVDGYAGTGRYPDGTAASGEVLLKSALTVDRARVALIEADPGCRASLEALVADYQSAKPMPWVDLYLADNRVALPEVMKRAAQTHVFLFLDPCGAGLPFEDLVAIVRDRGTYPRTELMLNFSGNLVRRTGARVVKDGLDCPSLDGVCGGDWWREIAQETYDEEGNWDAALRIVVEKYSESLGSEIGQSVIAVPVKRRITGQTQFYMVCTTPHPYGYFSLSDATAKAIKAWLNEPEKREDSDQGSLFDESTFRRPVETSKRKFRENVLAAVRARPVVSMVGDSFALLEGVVGELTLKELGEELRLLEKRELIRIIRPANNSGTRGYLLQAAWR